MLSVALTGAWLALDFVMVMLFYVASELVSAFRLLFHLYIDYSLMFHWKLQHFTS